MRVGFDGFNKNEKRNEIIIIDFPTDELSKLMETQNPYKLQIKI